MTGNEKWRDNQKLFSREKLKFIVAPMVEQSELAWRLLGLKYGSTLTYSPMLNAKLFVENLKYRNEMLTTIKEEITNQTLIIQFCANNPDYFLKAAELVQDQCIAVDLNLGCPQHIAKRGNYGSFLQDKWDLVEKMVSTLAKNLKIPITCKIRVFESIEKTVEYAKMIEKAGASLLTVHGRLRSQKGTVTGLADWSKIAAVKRALSIPVVANGNILYRQDIDKCLQATGADGVMSAEGHLYNPAIFTDEYYASWYMAEEYLKIVQLYPHSATPSQGKAHFFKLFHSLLSIYTDLRDFLGSKITTWNDLIHFVSQVKERVIKDYGSLELYTGPFETDQDGFLRLPPWVCQPKLRKHALLLSTPATDPVQVKRKDMIPETESGSIAENNRNQPSKKARIDNSTICNGINCKNTGSDLCVEKKCKGCCKSKVECPQHLRNKKRNRNNRDGKENMHVNMVADEKKVALGEGGALLTSNSCLIL